MPNAGLGFLTNRDPDQALGATVPLCEEPVERKEFGCPGCLRGGKAPDSKAILIQVDSPEESTFAHSEAEF